MDERNEQIERITRYESIFDSVSAAVRRVSDSLDELEELAPRIGELTAYYTGSEWKKDFEDDEAGLIPKTLKRGVLSEDGVYDLLDELGKMKTRIPEPVPAQDPEPPAGSADNKKTMKVLLLSCSTGEGHNHCARAVREALDSLGVHTDFFDMLHLFGQPGPIGVEQLLNVISTKAPDLFGLMYKAGEKVSALGVTSPVYLVNTTYGRKLCDLINEKEYDAVVCSHLFPMETLTFIRRRYELKAHCYGILSDYTCIPFLSETELDGYFLPHEKVSAQCEEAGIPAGKLIVTGMPVSSAFRSDMTREAARESLGIDAGAKMYLVMTGGIGCGDAVGLCDKLMQLSGEDTLLCVLAGRNQELLDSLNEKYSGDRRVIAVPFTDKVSVYMRAADVLLSKAGGISSAEAAVANVPLVHTMMIPGVETLNAEFFSGLGMSLMADNFDEAARFADRIIYDGRTGVMITEAQRTHILPDGARRIAEYIVLNDDMCLE